MDLVNVLYLEYVKVRKHQAVVTASVVDDVTHDAPGYFMNAQSERAGFYQVWAFSFRNVLFRKFSLHTNKVV